MTQAPLFSLGPEEFSRGTVSNPTGTEQPFLELLNGCTVINGVISPAYGTAIYDNATVPLGGNQVKGLHGQRISGSDELFIGLNANIYNGDGSTAPSSVGSGYTGSTYDFWQFAPHGTWTLATNGVDQIQVYKGVSFANLGGTPPTTAKLIVPRSPFMIALNTNTDETHYAWCDRDDVEDWVNTTTNYAADGNIRDLGSEITWAREYQGEILVGGDSKLYLIEWVRAPFSFGHRQLLSGFGFVGQRSGTVIGDTYFGAHSNGFFAGRGRNAEFVDGPIKHWLKPRESVSALALSTELVYYDQLTKKIIWVPAAASVSSDLTSGTGFAFDPKDGHWETVDPTFLGYCYSADETGIFSEQWVGSNDGKLRSREDYGATALAASNPHVRSKDLHLGHPTFDKHVDTVRLEIMNPEHFTSQSKLTIGYRDELDDAWSELEWSNPSNWLEPFTINKSAKYFRIEVEDPGGADGTWRISRIVFYGTKDIGR